MMRAVLLMGALALAACGIDGPPSAPENAIPDDGIAGVGVVGTL